MAKARSRSRKSGQGSYCITTSKPKPKGSKRGRGGLIIQTVCYKTQAAADARFLDMKRGAYTAMMHRKGKKKL